MDALGLFLLRYHAVHGGFVDDLFAGLDDAQVRARPHGLNSVVWLVWHATRVEDAAFNGPGGGGLRRTSGDKAKNGRGKNAEADESRQ